MFMTYDDREKVRDVLSSYTMWAYEQCEYSEKEVRFVVATEIESEINNLEEQVRILKLAKSYIQEEGL